MTGGARPDEGVPLIVALHPMDGDPADFLPLLRGYRRRARLILQSLPEEYRLPLTLRYIDGADYDTIQMQLGLTAGSLRGILYRGLQLLRRSVKQEVSHESR
jgi:DNA-directed RNA polymerase specialized sigma24 family protein